MNVEDEMRDEPRFIIDEPHRFSFDRGTIRNIGTQVGRFMHTEECKRRMAECNDSEESRDAFYDWFGDALLDAIRPRIAVVEAHRTPGFRAVNDELRAAIGKVVTLHTHAEDGILLLDRVSLDDARDHELLEVDES